MSEIFLGDVVIVGVGEVGRGDDGAGPLLAEMLAKAGVRNVVDSGTTPELDTWKIKSLAPDTVLFVDAVDFGGKPGEAAILSAGDLRTNGFDTHRAPLKLVMEYLEKEVKCKCHVLAIQPSNVGLEAPMCREVSSSVENLARIISQSLPSVEVAQIR